MDIDSLKAFLAVTENQSFSLAAEKLFLTQPAISKRIANLESQLNTTLFDRIGRQVHLTDTGKSLLPKARLILQELEDIQRSITNLAGTISGQLSLATSHHIGLHRLPPLLRQFSENHPEVNLELQFVDSEVAHQLVMQGKVELAIVTLSPEPYEQIQSECIWPDPLSFIAAHDHPLAQCRKLSVTELSNHNAILPSSNTFTRQIIEKTFAKSKLPLSVSMATNYLETIKMLVSVRLGWSILPATMVDNSIKKLSIKNVCLTRELGYIRHKNRTLSNAAHAFIDLMKDTEK